MITDALLTLSSAQAVTASAVSTNTIDLTAIRDVGAGEQVEVYFNVDTTVTAAGAATVNFQVITSAAAALTSPTILAQTDAIPKASLTAGVRFAIQVPRAQLTEKGQRYLGVQYTVATGPLTAGAFSSGIVLDYGDSTKSYTSGYSVT